MQCGVMTKLSSAGDMVVGSDTGAAFGGLQERSGVRCV